MKVINVIIAFLLAVSLCFVFVGCAKCTSIQYEVVEVTVVEEHYRAMWMQPVRAGKVTSFITHPAKYLITVDYNGVEYTINDSDTYDKYKDKIGQNTNGKLEVKNYDDGTVKYNIVSLE